MATTPLPIANGQYVSDSAPISAQECVNVFPVLEEAPSLNMETLRSIPGITQVATSGSDSSDANRGVGFLSGKPYFVNGTGLYRLNSNHTLDSLGTIAGTDRVVMDNNGTQLMILEPKGNGYIFTTGPDTLTQITDTDFTTTNGAPKGLVFIDGYFVCTTSTEKIICSNLNDGLTWDALDFSTVESDPDAAIAPIVYKNQLFVCGTRTTEAFTNVGGSGFPFSRANLFLEQGVVSEYALVNILDTFVFAGRGYDEFISIYQMAGNTTQKISTLAIDEILDDVSQSEKNDIYAWSYVQNGHFFVGFQLPSTTLVYDMVTGRWHERKSRIYNTTSKIWETKPWRATGVVSAYGNYYVADTEDGRIGQLSTDTYSEYTNEIVCTWATQPFQNNMRPFFVPYLELTLESGVGDLSTDDPQVMMERSRDGGHTFTDQRWRPMGKIGEYSRRAIWRRNGKVDRTDMYRFHIADKIKKVGIQLTGEVEGT